MGSQNIGGKVMRWLKPWNLSYVQKIDDPRVQVIVHGLLAPSAHNTQPWKISLDRGNPLVFNLFVDSSRLLPHSDPYSRQITMSQGTFLENVSIDTHPAAQVTLEKAEQENHALYDSITRATSKSYLESGQLASDVVGYLQGINSDADLAVMIFHEDQSFKRDRSFKCSRA